MGRPPFGNPTGPVSPLDKQTRFALHLQTESIKQWGTTGAVVLLGRDPAFRDVQDRLRRFLPLDRPVLITGESGVGKEAFARALYLLGERRCGPFLSVNCAQFRSEHLLVSELFGHKKGTFTGATADRKGLFEQADGGVVFLDEVGEMTAEVQAMLLRTLDRGEVLPLGVSEPRHVDVRVVAATNRDPAACVEAGTLRRDLYYRLAHLRLVVPPLRDRGDDWRIILTDSLHTLNREHGTDKQLSDAALHRLGRYPWPGNVRELLALADSAYCVSPSGVIDVEHVSDPLRTAPRVGPTPGARRGDRTTHLFRSMERGQQTFWDAVHQPYLDRDLNRAQVRRIVADGLRVSGGRYKALLPLFGIDDDQYHKFMDFLRHHDLKPRRF